MRIVNVCVPSINVPEILMFVILFILLLISITSFIVPNKPQHISIACLSLRSVKFKLYMVIFFLFVCLFVCLLFLLFLLFLLLLFLSSFN